MARVKLYGYLKRFGDEFELAVETSGEAVRALCCQIDGFANAMRKGYYKIRVNKRSYREESINTDMQQELTDNDTVHITPVVSGAKGGGFFAVLGIVVLVAATFATGGVATALYGMGGALLMSGVAQMLTKTPSTRTNTSDTETKKQSTSFSNLGNMVAQGRPVPLAYGRIMVGSLVISKGAETHFAQNDATETQATYAKTGVRGLFRR